MTFSVLFVDDNADIRDIVRIQLSFAEGLRLFEASNGDEGYEKFREARPDLVILDYLMPGRTGLELARVLRQEGYLEPLIIYSSANFLLDPDEVTALNLEVFEKVDFSELVKRIITFVV